MDDACIAIVVSRTFLEEVAPEIDASLGCYESIDDEVECCEDNKKMKCRSSGSRLIFGFAAEASAKWEIDGELQVCEQGCPKPGRHNEVLVGTNAEGGFLGIGGEAKFKAGLRIDPTGRVIPMSECSAGWSLPGGLGGELELLTGNKAALSIVASIRAEYEFGGGVDVGSFGTWWVECEDTGDCYD